MYSKLCKFDGKNVPSDLELHIFPKIPYTRRRTDPDEKDPDTKG